MRDALGGTVNLVIVIVFIVIVFGYLAFNVNYTKAFRMKNKIISTYEDYNGDCDSDCQKIIQDYAKQVGYRPDIPSCPEGMHEANNVILSEGYSGKYCFKEISVNSSASTSGNDYIPMDSSSRKYYRIATKITVDIPIIKNVIGDLRVFWVYGDTKVFKKEN